MKNNLLLILTTQTNLKKDFTRLKKDGFRWNDYDEINPLQDSKKVFNNDEDFKAEFIFIDRESWNDKTERLIYPVSKGDDLLCFLEDETKIVKKYDKKVDGFHCPICDCPTKYSTRKRKDENQLGKTHFYVCPECSFISFEFHDYQNLDNFNKKFN